MKIENCDFHPGSHYWTRTSGLSRRGGLKLIYQFFVYHVMFYFFYFITSFKVNQALFEHLPLVCYNRFYMYRRTVNFVRPRQYDTQGGKGRPVVALLAGLIVVLLVGGLIWGVKAIFSPSSASGSGKVLTARGSGILQTVTSIFFDTEEKFKGLKGYDEDRINILLLGIGGPGHDGPYLSDTIILASIKPSTHEVALISIPRDLAVKFKGSYQKINAVSSFSENDHPGQGAEYVRQFYEKQFDISIPYYVRVSFQALVDAVNAVGGITVNVPRELTDKKYPNDNGKEDKQNGPDCAGEDPSSPCRYLKVHFEVGEQTMNGERALIYARSRYGTDGDDHGRSARQQLIILALKDKLLSLGTLVNPYKIKGLYDSLVKNISTNLEFNELVALAQFSQTIERSTIRNLVLEQPELGFMVDAPQLGIGAAKAPASGNFEQINKAIHYIFEPSAIAFLEKQKKTFAPPSSTTSGANSTPTKPTTPKIEVQNGTWQAGLAAQVKKDLETKGFTIASINNSIQRPIDTTVIYILNDKIKSEQVTNLKEQLQAELRTTLPDWLKNTTSTPAYQSGTDVLIIIGNNYKGN